MLDVAVHVILDFVVNISDLQQRLLQEMVAEIFADKCAINSGIIPAQIDHILN